MPDPGAANVRRGAGQLTGLADTAPILLDAAVLLLTKDRDGGDQIRWARDKICQEKLSDPPVWLGDYWRFLAVIGGEGGMVVKS
jgi:hypothetical protein